MTRIIPASKLRHTRGRRLSYDLPDVKPLWSVNLEDPEAICEWFNQTVGELESLHNEMVELQERNRLFYQGIQSVNGNRSLDSDGSRKQAERRNFSRVYVNRLHGLVELWVAKLTRYAPNVVVNPANVEFGDRVSAKLGKLIADNLAYNNDMDTLLENAVRYSRVDGEAYISVDWDAYTGDYAQNAAEIKDSEEEIVTNSAGEVVLGLDGEPLRRAMKKRIGDVKFNLRESRFILLEPRMAYKDVDWCIILKVRYADELRAEYPDSAEEILGGEMGPGGFNFLRISEKEILEYELYHRKTANLPQGAHIRFAGDVCLCAEPYDRVSAGEMLPIVRYSCVDYPGHLRGVSFLENLLVPQVLSNHLLSIAYTNMSLASHAYWLVPTQANVDTEKLRNGNAVIKFTGPQAPKLEVFPTVGGELFKSIEFLSQAIDQGSGHQGLSQGDPPPGVDAAVALGVLEEQEQQRANPEIKKYNSFIKKLYVLGLGLAQDRYKTDDGRLLRIVGKNNQDTLKAIDTSKFAGSYDVRIERSTALSESKSLRMQQLIMIKQNWPDAMDDTRFLDMLELGDSEQFFDVVAASTRAAEYENEKFFGGESVKEPLEFEEDIAHLRVHYPFISTLSFKEDLPESNQKEVYKHILAHEFSAFRKASINTALLQQLISMPEYPKFFKLPIPLTDVARLMQNGVPLDQALDAKAAGAGGGPPPGAPAPSAPPDGDGAPEGAPEAPPPPGSPAPPEQAAAPEQPAQPEEGAPTPQPPRKPRTIHVQKTGDGQYQIHDAGDAQ